MIASLILVLCQEPAPEPAVPPEPEAAQEAAEAAEAKGRVAAAAALIGLELDERERALMLDVLEQRRLLYGELRATSVGNEVLPALTFSPLVPGIEARREAPGPPSAAMTRFERLERPADLEELAFAGILELGDLLRRGELSCVELCGMYLARLERLDEQLECVIESMAGSALERAAELDAELARGIDRGPLHGIPWGAKDLLATRGARTTWGAKPFEEQHIDADATVVRRLEEAGAVLIAKLSLGALAMGEVWFGGRTRNPWRPEQGSSGSSAGSAAATAAGGVVFAIGSETLGSIVSPSARCGCSSLRPTFGRVSRHGAMALSWSMDKLGPICRSARDAAIVLRAIAGPDGLDPSVHDLPLPQGIATPLEELVVGFPEGLVERDENLARVVAELEELGVSARPVAIPEHPVDALLIVLSAEAATAFDELTRSNADDLLVRQDRSAWPNTFRAARFVPAVEYLRAQRLRTRLMLDFERALEDIDVLVHPNFARELLGITNLTGHPTFVAPSGPAEEGAPPTISFTGRLFQEATLLELVAAWQAATGWHEQRPPLALEAAAAGGR